MQPIDFLAVGHVCHDWTPSGNILGGTVSYASIFAKKLNLNTAVFTSFGSDFEFQDRFQNISLRYSLSDKTTQFKNIYQNQNRNQFLLNKSNNILTCDFKPHIKTPKMVLLGPIANEVDLNFIDHFNESMVAVCPQGWMRQWDNNGKIFHKMFDDWSIFSNADLVILSEEDLNFKLELIAELSSIFKLLVVTKGKEGAEVYYNNNKYTFKSFPSRVIDPTGAGDIFATAFLVRFFETRDFSQAALFANSAASFCIEKQGLNGIVGREKILSRISNQI